MVRLTGACMLGLLSACDVVFRLDDVTPPQDARIDAPPEVIAHYRFESTGPVIADETGRHDGTAFGMLTAVPGQTGMAIEVTGSGAFVAVAHTPDWDLMTGAIDVWVRPAPGTELTGILSRDSSGPAGGHFALMQLGQTAFVARFQRAIDGTGGAGVFLCSTAPIGTAWTHVVINLGEPTPEMWVDGVRQNGTQTIFIFSADRTCGVQEPRGISGNDEQFVFGALTVASTEGTIDRVDHPLTGGAIDELRILRTRVTY